MSLTLAELEQSVARRIGPYLSTYSDRQVPTTATFDTVVCPRLRTSANIDRVENLFLLRRGVLLDGTSISVDPADRQRIVASTDADFGRIYVDQQWATPPSSGEVLEFHHLDPEQELRPAVLAGLARCYVPDTLVVQPTDQWGQVDLTAQYPWLTDPWQLYRVQYGWVQPYLDAPYEAVNMGGHLMLTGASGYWYYPSSMWISAWRPSTSWVNGAESTTGPVADDDVLDVDGSYAAAAGHIEGWHLFPSRMVAAAAGGYQATQQMAATEFSRLASSFGPGRNVSYEFTTMVGVSSHGYTWGHTWVNR